MLLTKKQQRFVEEFPLDCNGTQAAIRAGYSLKTAQEQSSRLLSNVMVREAIDDAMKTRAERTKIDADWVVQNLRNVYLEVLAAKDFSATIRCLELLGKHTGAFEKHQTQKRYTPEDLAAIRKRLEEQGMDFSEPNRLKPDEFPSSNAPVNRLPVSEFSAN